ncbi:MAG: GPW/gp25 family protein [Bacteroidia bacterium]|nr:GPW/gp25 family protein [Bacteroidia bacterium]
MKTDKTSFLGRGWSFPPEFEASGDTHMVEKEKDIRESLFILLSTTPGERIMHPDYGCGLNKLVFEPGSSSLVRSIQDMVQYAILMFEPRIKLQTVDVEYSSQEALVYITIDYYVRQTNTRQNMVYPMYLIEGTNLQGIK